MSDTPAIEPLHPALEEAARCIAHEWMERLGYAKGIPEQAQRLLDVGEPPRVDSVRDLKETLEFVRFVLERVPRDPAAELVAAVESGLHYVKWAEEHGHMGAPSSRTLIEAALARVKGGEHG